MSFRALSTFIALLFTALPAQADLSLNGTWKLVIVGCVSGNLGKLGLENQKGIASRTETETLTISGNEVKTVFQERKRPVRKQDYCETTFTQKWTINGNSVHVSDIQFVDRTSHGKFKCYEPYSERTAKQPDYDVKIQATPNLLSIISPDLKVIDAKKRERHFCSEGSNFIRTYQHVNGS